MEQNSQKVAGQAIDPSHLSLKIIQLVQRARRLRVVLALKRVQRPFALWPLIAALIRPGKALVRLSRTSTVKMDQLKRPIPIYSLILVLLLGVAGGAYASSALIHGTLNADSNAPDFIVALSPPSLTLTPGSVATVAVRLSSIYGFAGSVNLNATPPTATNMTVAANPSSVSLLTGNGTSMLTVLVPSSTPTGSFTMNLTGYSGRLSHLAQAFLLIVPPPSRDFTIAANSTSLALSQGSSVTASVTLSSVSGFSGIVNLTATVSPIVGNGPSASLNPTKVTLTSGGNASSLFSVMTSGSSPRRGYTIFVLATSGTFSHSLSISLTVQ